MFGHGVSCTAQHGRITTVTNAPGNTTTSCGGILHKLKGIKGVNNRTAGSKTEEQKKEHGKQLQGYAMHEPWVMLSLALFSVAGVCWLYVVYLQISMRGLAQQALAQQTELGAIYYRQVKVWMWLGVIAFSCIVMVFFLMVFKPM